MESPAKRGELSFFFPLDPSEQYWVTPEFIVHSEDSPWSQYMYMHVSKRIFILLSALAIPGDYDEGTD